jgi:hypothetical protein
MTNYLYKFTHVNLNILANLYHFYLSLFTFITNPFNQFFIYTLKNKLKKLKIN